MRAFVLLMSALSLEAGVIQGVVVEHVSGVPLARTVVKLQPVDKPGGGEVRTLQARADKSGHFEFTGIPDGLFLLTATRANYFPAAFGQRRPDGQGTPIEVNADSKTFAELRMKRRGVLTGKVVDENGVGIQKVGVVAYRARQPVRVIAQAETDDRGVYRIIGLDPARYWVRTTAAVLDDGASIVPTFGSEAREVRDARVHELRPDVETQYADVRPEFGALFHLRGRVVCPGPSLPVPVIVTLSSETGRRTTQTNCVDQVYQFEGLAPAFYEVFATFPGVEGGASGFIELFLDRDNENGSVQMADDPKVTFEMGKRGTPRDAREALNIVARRVDLFGPGRDHVISTSQAVLSAGHWEMNAKVGAGRYVESIANLQGASRSAATRPFQWFPVFLGVRSLANVRIVVSDQPARIEGVVSERDKAVPGIPVFIWPVKESARRAVGTVQTLTNIEGKFTAEGLPPGEYRLLATFDVSEVDDEILDEARAITIKVEASQSATITLTPWNAQ